ncbi:hypothetical protein J6590_061091 [Homalodisca vitripennis]|nr:hypothetical protein J6590_061091 [Homalodisca vitripennis]
MELELSHGISLESGTVVPEQPGTPVVLFIGLALLLMYRLGLQEKPYSEPVDDSDVDKDYLPSSDTAATTDVSDKSKKQMYGKLKRKRCNNPMEIDLVILVAKGEALHDQSSVQEIDDLSKQKQHVKSGEVLRHAGSTNFV